MLNNAFPFTSIKSLAPAVTVDEMEGAMDSASLRVLSLLLHITLQEIS